MIEMKRTVLLVMIVFGSMTQCRTTTYDPDETLTPQEKDKFKMSIVRYVTKPPENVGANEKFDKKFDQYYQERASACRLEQYYKNGDEEYFLVSQPAPSLTEKRHATGGKLTKDADDKIIQYEEVFRTWKMIPDTLRRRSFMLFDRMVKGKSLELYETKNSIPEEYIEFPDDNTYFDKGARTWVTKSN
jgi:hypothetical protein